MKLEEGGTRDLCSIVGSLPRMYTYTCTGSGAQEPEFHFPLSHEHPGFTHHNRDERDQRPGDK
jgi:hypothetical protein